MLVQILQASLFIDSSMSISF